MRGSGVVLGAAHGGQRIAGQTACGEELLDARQVVRVTHHHDEVGRAGVDVRVGVSDLLRADRHRPLDRLRVAADAAHQSSSTAFLWAKLSTGPKVFHASACSATRRKRDLLARRHRRGSAAVRRVRAPARARRAFTRGQRLTEVAQAARGRAELVAVLLVVALEPAGRRARGRDARPRAGRRCAPCRRRGRGSGTSCSPRAARAGPGWCRRPWPPAATSASKCGARGIAVEREEVVPRPDAVDAELVGGTPRGAQLVESRRLRMELYPDVEAGHVSPRNVGHATSRAWDRSVPRRRAPCCPARTSTRAARPR